jgi:hypothetical protein
MKARTCLLAPVGALGAALLSLLAGYGLSAGGVDRELTADELALIKGRQPLPTCYHCLYGYQVATPSCSEPEPCYGCVVGSGANCGLESWDPSFLESVDRYTVTYEDDESMSNPRVAMWRSGKRRRELLPMLPWRVVES